MNNGFIFMHRKMTEWEWYKDNNTKSIFLHLLLKANHKEGSWQGNKIKEGQLVTGLHSLSKDTGISIQSIRTSLVRLKSTNEITIKSTNKFSLITIVKWAEYQSKQQASQQAIQQTTNKQLTTNNNDNNVNNNKLKKSKKRSTKKEGDGEMPKVPSASELKREYEDGLTRKPDFVNEVVWHEALLEMLRCKKEGKFLDPTKPDWLLNYDYRELLPFAVEHDIERGGLKRYAREIHSQYEAHDFKFVKTGKPIKNFKQLFKNIVNNEVEKLQRKFGKDSSFLH